MNYFLIIMSFFLGILAVLTEPVKKGKGNVIKRLRPSGVTILVLLLLSCLASIYIQYDTEKQEELQIIDMEFRNIQKDSIGPNFDIIFEFEDSIFQKPSFDDLYDEFQFVSKNLPQGSLEKYDVYTYIDSVSRKRLIPPFDKAKNMHSVMTFEFHSATFVGSFYINNKGGLGGGFLMNNSKNFPNHTDNMSFDYNKNKFIASGCFPRKFLGGAVYNSMINTKKSFKPGYLEFSFASELSNKDIESIKASVSRIKSIELRFVDDIESSEYLIVPLKLSNVAETRVNKYTQISFRVLYDGIPLNVRKND